jgi:hypothetical protein
MKDDTKNSLQTVKIIKQRQLIWYAMHWVNYCRKLDIEEQ